MNTGRREDIAATIGQLMKVAPVINEKSDVPPPMSTIITTAASLPICCSVKGSG